MMHGYTCKQCGAPAFLEQEGIRKTCTHDCSVIANMTATVYGEGYVEDKPSKLVQIVSKIISMIKGLPE